MIPGMERTPYLSLASSVGLWLAPLLHVTSFWLMLEEVEPFHTGFYSLAWWSYIVFVSAINQRWGGNSLLFDRWREFIWVFLVSTPAWLFFELCNFRLQNWHYLGVPSEWWVRLPGYFLAFGTVLPGIFETRTLLQNLGLRFGFRKVGAATSSSRKGRLALLGGLMLGVALLWPDLFFPLVWLGPILLLEWLVSLSGEEGPQRLSGSRGLFCGHPVAGFRTRLWRSVGVLELLGGGKMDLLATLSERGSSFRNASRRFSGLSALCSNLLSDVQTVHCSASLDHCRVVTTGSGRRALRLLLLAGFWRH